MTSNNKSGADAELVEQYIALEQSRSSDTEESWPVEALRAIVPREPGRAWRILKSLIGQASEELLPKIGVRELEEFIACHGPRFISEIEAQAQVDQHFRLALSNVWISKGDFTDDIEQRLVTASNGTMTVLRND